MGNSFGSRTLLAVCCASVGLLAALAAVQYRWSARVASADAQREREHLESAASLFAREFNEIASQSIRFLQNDALAALRAGEPLKGVPKLVGELYFLDVPRDGNRQVLRFASHGRFTEASMPEWIGIPHCAPIVIEQPPALVAPVYDVSTSESHQADRTHIRKTFRWRTDRCFVARMDLSHLRDVLIPQIIRHSFGETATREYDFAIVSTGQTGHALYGNPGRADLRKPFFSISANPPWLPKLLPSGTAPPLGQPAVLIQRMETVLSKGIGDLLGPGTWELQVARKGLPLAEVFERNRRRDLLLSLAVEVLLLAAIAFLVVASRRVQRLADQKMRFVAGVSHELRTPVSAIAMLSRNQADGLVNGADKVKQYGELIHQQSRRLNDMVEQTLQYAGIHSGLRKPSRNQVDLASLIHEAVDARREELKRGGIDVEMALGPSLPAVLGDAKLLRTAFDNLLDNAVKHAGGGRWVRVRAVHDEPLKEIRLSVEDRGAGIDPADQAEIFEPFCRGRAAVEAQIPGSGLGLSLVRSAAEAHQGSVTLVSEPGRGSTFTMHLPV